MGTKTINREDIMTNLPEKIYLQVDPEEENPELFDPPYEGVTWCTDKINDNDVEYIRPETLYEKIRELPEKLVIGVDTEEDE